MSNNNQNSQRRFPTPRNAAQNQQNQKPSRFGGSRFGNNNNNSGSRFGGSSSRFGSSSSRFGGNNQTGLQWTVAPMKQSAVRISLNGLGDPLARLLGTTLNPDMSNPEKLYQVLAGDADLMAQLTQVLDESWEGYGLHGAAMVYPWEDNIRRAFTHVAHPVEEPPKQNNNANDTKDEDHYEDDNDQAQPQGDALNKGMQCLRAVDAAFVLNILARVRANVIVSNTPLALEEGFLEKTIICDDPRIVEIAQATGCIDEDW